MLSTEKITSRRGTDISVTFYSWDELCLDNAKNTGVILYDVQFSLSFKFTRSVTILYPRTRKGGEGRGKGEGSDMARRRCGGVRVLVCNLYVCCGSFKKLFKRNFNLFRGEKDVAKGSCILPLIAEESVSKRNPCIKPTKNDTEIRESNYQAIASQIT